MSIDEHRIEQSLRTYLLANFYVGNHESLTSDTPLLTSGILDSISALQMVDFIEESYGIEFEAHEVDEENLRSIKTIADFIRAKIKV
ncbi:MAG: acyl carrier protein [Saprospiraceae bacterium]|jgi:acyl carrier protein